MTWVARIPSCRPRLRHIWRKTRVAVQVAVQPALGGRKRDADTSSPRPTREYFPRDRKGIYIN